MAEKGDEMLLPYVQESNALKTEIYLLKSRIALLEHNEKMALLTEMRDSISNLLTNILQYLKMLSSNKDKICNHLNTPISNQVKSLNLSSESHCAIIDVINQLKQFIEKYDNYRKACSDSCKINVETFFSYIKKVYLNWERNVIDIDELVNNCTKCMNAVDAAIEYRKTAEDNSQMTNRTGDSDTLGCAPIENSSLGCAPIENSSSITSSGMTTFLNENLKSSTPKNEK